MCSDFLNKSFDLTILVPTTVISKDDAVSSSSAPPRFHVW